MEDYLGMRSVAASKFEQSDGQSSGVGAGSMPAGDAAHQTGTGQPAGDLGSSILQSLLYWERIFAYQEGGKPRRTNGDEECVEKAGSGTEDEPISD